MNRLIKYSPLAAASALLIALVVRAQEAPPEPTPQPALSVPAEVAAPPAPPAVAAAAAVAGEVPTNRYGNVDIFAPARVPMATTFTGQIRKRMDPAVAKLMDSDRHLTGEILALAHVYKDLDDAKQHEASAQLEKYVSKQFEIRQHLRKRELAELEAQLERLRTLHDQRNEQKERIVGDRVNQLLRDAEGLGWGELSDEGNLNWTIVPQLNELPAIGAKYPVETLKREAINAARAESLAVRAQLEEHRARAEAARVKEEAQRSNEENKSGETLWESPPRTDTN